MAIPRPPKGVRVNHHAFFVIFDTEINKKLFLKLLKEKNIHSYIGYTPLHSSKMGKSFGYNSNDLPITEDISRRIVRLPLYNELKDEKNLRYCIKGIKSALNIIYD